MQTTGDLRAVPLEASNGCQPPVDSTATTITIELQETREYRLRLPILKTEAQYRLVLRALRWEDVLVRMVKGAAHLTSTSSPPCTHVRYGDEVAEVEDLREARARREREKEAAAAAKKEESRKRQLEWLRSRVQSLKAGGCPDRLRDPRDGTTTTYTRTAFLTHYGHRKGEAAWGQAKQAYNRWREKALQEAHNRLRLLANDGTAREDPACHTDATSTAPSDEQIRLLTLRLQQCETALQTEGAKREELALQLHSSRAQERSTMQAVQAEVGKLSDGLAQVTGHVQRASMAVGKVEEAMAQHIDDWESRLEGRLNSWAHELQRHREADRAEREEEAQRQSAEWDKRMQRLQQLYIPPSPAPITPDTASRKNPKQGGRRLKSASRSSRSSTTTPQSKLGSTPPTALLPIPTSAAPATPSAFSPYINPHVEQRPLLVLVPLAGVLRASGEGAVSSEDLIQDAVHADPGAQVLLPTGHPTKLEVERDLLRLLLGLQEGDLLRLFRNLFAEGSSFGLVPDRGYRGSERHLSSWG
eukprot:TRINITY_DN15109_c0_g3_i2.p1 TRINITY_DN15109_c0_g3~~TRINITY_DN15109_c0_g3_i2.p1  ORF type:complete len:580 (+),score=35.06 TRINITY_DN15109_c0_g3_i2:153-1742(+)